MDTDPDVEDLLSQLREHGAHVEVGAPASEAELAAAEATLGFALPDEYREFLGMYGGIAIECERTWFLYGLAEALRWTEVYRAEFDSFRDEDDDGGPYYPKRFIVLHDEGDYSNAASGIVYDADLGALLYTDGGRWVDADDAFEMGYWDFLFETLDKVLGRVSDEDDILVAGGSRDRANKEHERRAAIEALPRGVAARYEAAISGLYDAFADYPRQRRERECFMGRCGECEASDAALNDKALRELGAFDLFHYAYNALNESVDDASVMPDRKREFKHYAPRILELLDTMGDSGNPSVVIGTLLRNLLRTELSTEERAAVDAFLLARFSRYLHGVFVTDWKATMRLREEFAAALRVGISASDLLKEWDAATGVIPMLHAADLACDEKHDETPDYYGVYDEAAEYQKLRDWLRSDALQARLRAAQAEATPSERERLELALLD